MALDEESDTSVAVLVNFYFNSGGIALKLL